MANRYYPSGARIRIVLDNQERLYGIRRQLDLRGYRVDRLNPGPPRDTLIAKAKEKTLSSPHALDGASGDSISFSAAGNISSDCSQRVTRKEVTLGRLRGEVLKLHHRRAGDALEVAEIAR